MKAITQCELVVTYINHVYYFKYPGSCSLVNILSYLLSPRFHPFTFERQLKNEKLAYYFDNGESDFSDDKQFTDVKIDQRIQEIG